MTYSSKNMDKVMSGLIKSGKMKGGKKMTGGGKGTGRGSGKKSGGKKGGCK